MRLSAKPQAAFGLPPAPEFKAELPSPEEQERLYQEMMEKDGHEWQRQLAVLLFDDFVEEVLFPASFANESGAACRAFHLSLEHGRGESVGLLAA